MTFSPSFRLLHFKGIRCALKLTFGKRITIIFGRNSSGKSSIFEALKVLASPEMPVRPIKNVKANVPGTPAFGFQFRTDAAAQQWIPGVGYGTRRAIVKYFDTAIAVRNATDAVDPGRIIAIAPFKLHVFELAKSLTIQFRDHLQQLRQTNANALAQKLQQIRQEFAPFIGRTLSSAWTEGRAIWNKGATGVLLTNARCGKSLPFALLGSDCDNGSEFLNWTLVRHFQQRPNPVKFTPSRPYHKDDNAHVEQKNWMWPRCHFPMRQQANCHFLALPPGSRGLSWSFR